MFLLTVAGGRLVQRGEWWCSGDLLGLLIGHGIPGQPSLRAKTSINSRQPSSILHLTFIKILFLQQNQKQPQMFRPRFASAAQPLWRPARLQLRPNSFARPQSTETSPSSRIDRITSKLPRRLQKYTTELRNAPVSHVISFLILHELTAIAPLLALFGVFHYTDYVPVSWITEHFGSNVQNGVARFERYFAKKGWFGFSGGDLGSNPLSDGAKSGSKEQTEEAMERFQSGDQKYKVLVEVALAYAVTKAILPLRIIGSVWATPWFAGVLMKVRGAVSRKS